MYNRNYDRFDYARIHSKLQADFASGTCIGLISIALTDKSEALIYYLDDKMKYSREMLIAAPPQFLNKLEKQKNSITPQLTE